MTNQTRSAVHDAATKAETLAYNLASASSLASVMSEVLDKEIGGTIEGQSLAALITLLDKLAEDCEELSGELYALSRGIAPRGRRSRRRHMRRRGRIAQLRTTDGRRKRPRFGGAFPCPRALLRSGFRV